MSVTSDLTEIKTKANGLKSNKVTNLAYDAIAYAENTVASPDSYDWSQHNNIPQQTASAMKMTETQIDKGWRLRFPILNKYFFNAFFGRVSYNLNKLTDFFSDLMDSLVASLGTANNIATLDANGRLPASQATETLLSYKGTWLASTNTPALSDGMAGAVKGDMYLCDDSGTVTFGTGNTWSFLPNDRVVYDGAKWNKWTAGRVRKVADVLPDNVGNIDLAQQSDVTKILSGTALGQLFYWGIGRNWVKCTESYGFREAVYANGLWVACDVNHGIWWSINGKNWTQGTGVNVNILAIAYANGLWVASSDSGMWWSEDGKSWTQGTGGEAYTFWAPVYANGLWVVGTNTYHGMWWSEDGKSWTQGTGGNINVTMYTVAYANGLWVAGSSGNGMWWSEDGKSWTQGTGANNTSTMYTVAYANGLWVACSINNGMWWSEDGKSWAQGTGENTTYAMYVVAYANGLWVAGSREHGVWWSEDGKSWVQASLGAYSATFTAVKYANSIWLSASVTDGLWISSDGKVWQRIANINILEVIPWKNIAFDQGMFILASTAGLYYSDWATI